MKKLLILLFMSLSLTAQSSSGPDWFDAPLEACFKAAEKGLFVGNFTSDIIIEAPEEYYGLSTCPASVRNFIYDEKEFSLGRVLKNSEDIFNDCEELNAAGYAFCEYTEFNNLEGVKPFYYD